MCAGCVWEAVGREELATLSLHCDCQDREQEEDRGGQGDRERLLPGTQI